MSTPDLSITPNLLLRALSPEDQARLAPHMTRVELARAQVLVTPHEPVEQVHFPEGGIVSVMAITPERVRVEAGLFGREGVSATCLLLGADRTPHESAVQIDSATALRIDTAPYLAAIEASRSLRTGLLRYVHTMLIQSAQNMATNVNQRLDARLARWLLMCHDRTDGDEIAVTHEVLGTMVSAERSGITLTLHVLEGAGMIRSERGRVLIRDRTALEGLAGDGYGVPEAAYRRLIGPLGRGAPPA